MAAQVGQYAANALLKKQMKGYANKKVDTGDDPYFAMVEDPRHRGKLKKVKKQVPAYIPEHDANVLASVRRNAYRLDMSLFNFLGLRFGWESVIGVVPFAGDAAGVLLALLVVRKCMEVEGGLSTMIVLRMLINIALDFTLGLVPFLGDLADAAFKCNTRNLRLLERVLDKKYKPQQADERDLVGLGITEKETRRRNRQSGIYMSHDPPPATAFEDFSDDELRQQQQEIGDVSAQQQPQNAHMPATQQRQSWFAGRRNQPLPPQPTGRPAAHVA